MAKKAKNYASLNGKSVSLTRTDGRVFTGTAVVGDDGTSLKIRTGRPGRPTVVPFDKIQEVQTVTA